MSARARGFSYLIIAMILLGSSLNAGATVAQVMPTSVALAGRLLLASAIMVPLLMRRGQALPLLSGPCYGLLCAQALIGVIAFNLMIFQAYRSTSTASVGIVFGLLPVVIAIMSVLFLRERPKWTLAVAVVLAVFGTVQLGQTGIQQGLGAASGAGLLLSIGALLCSGFFSTAGKALTSLLSPLAVAALVSVAGLLMITPLAISEVHNIEFTSIGTGRWLALAWWAGASGIGFFWLWFAGLARVEAHAAGLATVALPITTVTLSCLLQHEVVTIQHLLGATCTIAAVMAVSLPPLHLGHAVLLATRRVRTLL